VDGNSANEPGEQRTPLSARNSGNSSPFRFTSGGYFVTVFEKSSAASLFEGLKDCEEDNPHDEAIFAH
jgi:hypothetical protein